MAASDRATRRSERAIHRGYRELGELPRPEGERERAEPTAMVSTTTSVGVGLVAGIIIVPE